MYFYVVRRSWEELLSLLVTFGLELCYSAALKTVASQTTIYSRYRPAGKNVSMKIKTINGL